MRWMPLIEFSAQVSAHAPKSKVDLFQLNWQIGLIMMVLPVRSQCGFDYYCRYFHNETISRAMLVKSMPLNHCVWIWLCIFVFVCGKERFTKYIKSNNATEMGKLIIWLQITHASPGYEHLKIEAELTFFSHFIKNLVKFWNMFRLCFQ